MSNDYTGRGLFFSKTLTKAFVYVPEPSSSVAVFNPVQPPLATPKPVPPISSTPTGTGLRYTIYATKPFDAATYATLQQKYGGQVVYVSGSYWVPVWA